MKPMAKLPQREACPAFQSSKGLMEALIPSMILFAIKEKNKRKKKEKKKELYFIIKAAVLSDLFLNQ